MLMVVVLLVLLGLCFGSFVNAFVWRFHMQASAKTKIAKAKYSIVRGRSVCVDCKHQLASKDLLPVVSWLALKGKCRYCKKPIHWQYPLIELITAILFVASYLFWPNNLNSLVTVANFGLWLVLLVGFMFLVVYDLRWMILPNKVVLTLGVVALLFVLSIVIDQGSRVILQAILGSIVGGGLFWLLFEVSKGRWIGGGDVKLGFVLGLLLASPLNAAIMLFVASLLGTIVSLPMMLGKKITPSTRIPFGPFLLVATVLVQLFSANMINWYVQTFFNL